MAGPPAACGVSRHPDREIQAVNHDIYLSVTFRVDRLVGEASASNYHALILPSGAVNPDNLRQDGTAVGFVRDFVTGGKPVGVICHGPWTLVEADVVRDLILTSYPSVRTDVRNAGNVVDAEVVTDQNITYSRWPDDRRRSAPGSWSSLLRRKAACVPPHTR
jgi:protease I